MKKWERYYTFKNPLNLPEQITREQLGLSEELLNKKCTTPQALFSDIKQNGLALQISDPYGSNVFEGRLLNYQYFVISCRSGNAHLTDLDLATTQWMLYCVIMI